MLFGYFIKNSSLFAVVKAVNRNYEGQQKIDIVNINCWGLSLINANTSSSLNFIWEKLLKDERFFSGWNKFY